MEVLLEEPIEEVTTGDTVLRYDAESGEFIQKRPGTSKAPATGSL